MTYSCHHENYRDPYSEVPKRPIRRGLGSYSKKTRFFGQFFLAIFGLFLPFFSCFWPELYEGATFEQKVFSNFCSYSDRLYKTIWHCLKFQKKVFMSRSTVHIAHTVHTVQLTVSVASNHKLSTLCSA